MKILIVHNAYQQRGGEDVVSEAEATLLREAGHEVCEYRRHSDELRTMSIAGKMLGVIWSHRTNREISVLIDRACPDVVHVHNTFPLISPSVYWVANRRSIPVVQTLHNFRLLCPQAMLLRDGIPCEDCVGKFPWPGVLHACYRGSRTHTLGVAVTVASHHLIRTWESKVTRYIALNEFCRRKFVGAGLPARRVVVKPNFVSGCQLSEEDRAGVIFVGRLAPEKGILTLAEAARMATDVSITVAGAGPDAHRLENIPNVRMVGAIAGDEVLRAMHKAIALVMPSVWYENFPRTLVEAFSCRLPVIASRLGALEELVTDGVTGLLFEPGSASDLSDKLRWAATHPQEMRRMGNTAYHIYKTTYTPEVNYKQLMQIYAEALAEDG